MRLACSCGEKFLLAKRDGSGYGPRRDLQAAFGTWLEDHAFCANWPDNFDLEYEDPRNWDHQA